MIAQIRSFFFPHKCVFCGEFLKTSLLICPECAKKLPFLSGNLCSICGRPMPEDYIFPVCRPCVQAHFRFKAVFVPLVYKDAVRSAILRFKFGNKPSYARCFAKLMAAKIPDLPFDVVTYAPIHKKRRQKRGYDQAALLAQLLAKERKLPYAALLKRVRSTPAQSSLKRSARAENIKGAFAPRGRSLQGKTVLLVDDIMTTGATLNECARILLKNGAKAVYCAVIATTLLHEENQP